MTLFSSADNLRAAQVETARSIDENTVRLIEDLYDMVRVYGRAAIPTLGAFYTTCLLRPGIRLSAALRFIPREIG